MNEDDICRRIAASFSYEISYTKSQKFWNFGEEERKRKLMALDTCVRLLAYHFDLDDKKLIQMCFGSH